MNTVDSKAEIFLSDTGPVQEPVQDPNETPPDSLYAWAVLGCGVLIWVMTFGAINSFGVFQTYFLNTMFPTEPARNIAWIGTMTTACSFSCGVLATISIAHFGVKVTSIIGTLLGTLGLILASFSTKLWQLILTQGVVFGTGASININVSLVMPSLWFVKYRSLAIGITVTGTAVGSLILPPMQTAILNNLSIQWAYRIMAILYFVLVGLSIFFFKYRTPLPKRKVMEFSLFKNPTVFLLCMTGFFSLIGYITHLFYFAPSVVALGKSRSEAAVVIMLFSVSSAISRVMSGVLAPKLGAINIIIVSHTITGILMITMWGLGKSFACYVAFYILNGFFSVVIFPLASVIIANYFPKEKASLINGLLYLVMGISIVIGIPFTGYLFDKPGRRVDYSPVCYFGGACYLFTLVFLIPLRARIRKIDPGVSKWIV
ncbi:hypothetical protein BB560_000895 [Smittium megazygosporum]|uniref:Major facilitator superfamily (MFS) profile domain-containing protein n=1 Tax=Smittium megazygosporum TaxID=133381 RepID=A0A2T9ZJ04_9FUNG|nr:hypothetical protein BB560_000895 [Smittium megazygosporum]